MVRPDAIAARENRRDEIGHRRRFAGADEPNDSGIEHVDPSVDVPDLARLLDETAHAIPVERYNTERDIMRVLTNADGHGVSVQVMGAQHFPHVELSHEIAVEHDHRMR